MHIRRKEHKHPHNNTQNENSKEHTEDIDLYTCNHADEI